MADAVVEVRSSCPRPCPRARSSIVSYRPWPTLYADDAVVELPFHRPAPLRIDGRQHLEARNRAARDLPLELVPRRLVVHEITDPEVIVAAAYNLVRIARLMQPVTAG